MTGVFEAVAQPPSILDASVFESLSTQVALRVPHTTLALMVRHGDRLPAWHVVRCDSATHTEAWHNDHLQSCFGLPTGTLGKPLPGLSDALVVPVECRSDKVDARLVAALRRPEHVAEATELLTRVARLLGAFVPLALHYRRAARLAAVFERRGVGIIALNADGVVIESNESARRLLGRTDGIIGRSLRAVLEPSDGPTLDKLFQATAGRALVSLPADARRTLPLDLEIVAMDGSDESVAWQLTIHDATERLNADAGRIRHTEALGLLRDLAETVAAPTAARASLASAVELLRQRLGLRGAAVLERDDANGRLVPLASHAIESHTLEALAAGVLSQGCQSLEHALPDDVWTLGLPLNHADRLVGAAVFVFPTCPSSDDVDLLVLAARTMGVALAASLKYAEAVRLEAERRQLLDAVPNLVFRCDPETGETLFANAAVERVLGVSEMEALGLPGIDGMLADDDERAAVAILRQRVMTDGQSSWADRRYRHVDGRAITLRAKLFRVPAPQPRTHEPWVVECIAHDVTEELEARRQLVHADRMASLGVLAAGVAHEINNPAAFISLGVQQLARMVAQLSDTDATAAGVRRRMGEVVGELSDGIQRIVQIVGELKLFARIPESAYSTPVDVNQLISSAVTLVRAELRRRARLDLDLGDLPPLPGDHARLGQVFVNLLVNAAQAIPPGNEEQNVVQVTTRAFDGYVQVKVRDTGSGIEPRDIARIFDPFYTTKPAGEGTGLGLSISYDLVRRAGGVIDVDSEVGKGTTFTVRLPVRDFVPARGSKPAMVSVQTGHRVLVVEDEHHLGVAIARALATTYLVELAPSAETALERISAGAGVEYQAVLCDLHMPGMNGPTLYDAVRAKWPNQAARFVFVTGAARGSEFEQFVRSTDRPVIQKPFEMVELEEIVAAVVWPP